MFEWTDEAIQCVKDLWGKQSAGEIAGIIGHPSRSAVCGKANRLGLSHIHKQKARATPFRKPPDWKPPSKVYATPQEQQLLHDALRRSVKVISPNPCTLMDLTSETCRWPLWSNELSDQYCGSKPLDGCPYCGFHSRIAYQSGKGQMPKIAASHARCALDKRGGAQ
jgi:GcrA cell cycle regulator